MHTKALEIFFMAANAAESEMTLIWFIPLLKRKNGQLLVGIDHGIALRCPFLFLFWQVDALGRRGSNLSDNSRKDLSELCLRTQILGSDSICKIKIHTSRQLSSLTCLSATRDRPKEERNINSQPSLRHGFVLKLHDGSMMELQGSFPSETSNNVTLQHLSHHDKSVH